MNMEKNLLLKDTNEKLWDYCMQLRKEVAALKVTIAKLTEDKKEKGKGPEIYMDEVAFKNTYSSCFINKGKHVYSAQTEICVYCKEHISKHER